MLRCLELQRSGFTKTFFTENQADEKDKGAHENTHMSTHSHNLIKTLDVMAWSRPNWSWRALIQPDRRLSAPSRINNTCTQAHTGAGIHTFSRCCWNSASPSNAPPGGNWDKLSTEQISWEHQWVCLAKGDSACHNIIINYNLRMETSKQTVTESFTGTCGIVKKV